MSQRDIVKELRAVDHGSVEDCFLLSPLFGHAADEIERLRREVQEARAALLRIAALTDTSMDPTLSAQNMVPIMTEAARALALLAVWKDPTP